jgi:transposase
MTLSRYGTAFKKRALARLAAPENASFEEVARHTGVQVETLQRWQQESAAVVEHGSWTPTARLDAVLITSSMDETAKSAWCRSNGVHLQDLVAWRKSAIDALGDVRPVTASMNRPPSQAKEDRLRIQQLERDLRRKNAALAETAALLVLSKKMEEIWNKGGDE